MPPPTDGPRGREPLRGVTADLIGVPFDGFGRPGYQSDAPAVLRSAGLRAALDAHLEVERDLDLTLPPPQSERGHATTLMNEAALVALAAELGGAVAASVTQSRFPIVFGGDCTVLFGIVPALGASGDVGLMFVDGHEDTMPLDVSEDGEAANTEIGILLGITGRTLRGELARTRGTLDRSRLAVLGPRDQVWRSRFNVASVAGMGVWMRDSDAVIADPEVAGASAADQLGSGGRRWWLHVDLDVLDPTHFAAQGLPGVPDEPGGLSWQQLGALLKSALARGGCVGLSAVIYDPEQDPTRRDARQIVDLLASLARSLDRT